ncbi:hypothetical protein DFH06DRAFT_1473661 [Mycena polygramma]|nr:hypothetical protein DFH06DRAFT_1473661 [Mycena polygramma]
MPMPSDPAPVTIMSPPSASVTSLDADVDPQILEALASKDRIYVLKLGEQMEGLIADRSIRQRIDLTPATTYQRMLVHRCSAYYALAPETDSLTKAISVVVTTESRIPPRRLADLAPPPADTMTPPKFKIMLRNPRSSGSGSRSHTGSHNGSVTGDDPDSYASDGESSSATSTSKHRRTIEERTAAYNEARSRIFVDFTAEKEPASSSASSSASTAASEDPGSPATESEWSAPSVAGKKLPRSLRSSAPAFTSSTSTSTSTSSTSTSTSASSTSTSSSKSSANSSKSNSKSSSSRNSPSPASFTYPSLYEPPSSTAYDIPPQGMYPPHPQQQQQQPYYGAPVYYPPYGPYGGSDTDVYGGYNPYAWAGRQREGAAYVAGADAMGEADGNGNGDGNRTGGVNGNGAKGLARTMRARMSRCPQTPTPKHMSAVPAPHASIDLAADDAQLVRTHNAQGRSG